MRPEQKSTWFVTLTKCDADSFMAKTKARYVLVNSQLIFAEKTCVQDAHRSPDIDRSDWVFLFHATITDGSQIVSGEI